MTIGEMIAQLRSIQETHGDLAVYIMLKQDEPYTQLAYREVSAFAVDVEPAGIVPKRVIVSGWPSLTDLSVAVSDSAAVGDQLG